MDVLIQKPVTPEKLAAQAQTHRQMLEVCLTAQNCKPLMSFGVYARDAPSTHTPGFSAFAAPLLFDESFRPKPAYEALAEVLRSR